MLNNLWFSKIVAFAYRYQKEARPYRFLIRDFASYLRFHGQDSVLDIGCGSGRIIHLVWQFSGRCVKRIVGLDVSGLAIHFAKENLNRINPELNGQVEFVCADFNNGLPQFGNREFDLVTAGLSLQYAESQEDGRWTLKAYRKIFQEIFRVLKPGGQLVFSVNTPHPDFSRIAKKSWREIFLTWKLPLMLAVALIMVWQGRWLTKQADIGRFHYLPIEQVKMILSQTGFSNVRYKLTYAGLAWVVSCQKPS